MKHKIRYGLCVLNMLMKLNKTNRILYDSLESRAMSWLVLVFFALPNTRTFEAEENAHVCTHYRLANVCNFFSPLFSDSKAGKLSSSKPDFLSLACLKIKVMNATSRKWRRDTKRVRGEASPMRICHCYSSSSSYIFEQMENETVVFNLRQ